MGLGNGKARNTYETALMSDSWPVKVCVARPVRISQSFAAASQAPEMKTLLLPGARDKLKWKLISVILVLNGNKNYLITSPVWSLNSMTRTPASISQSMQVMSPELVTI